MQDLLIIAGPTGVGKSDLAIKLAKELDSEIINLDSVQVYKGFDIGSAKLSLAERQGVPHHLIDIRSPDRHFDAAEYKREADAVISDLAQRNKLPILVGGSTLYMKSLLYGLTDLPTSNTSLRVSLESRDLANLYEELKEKDPSTAKKINPNDSVRIIRSLESILLKGKPLSEMHIEHAFAKPHYHALILVVVRDREGLYQAINERTVKMLQAGLVDECKSLMKNYSTDAAPFKSIGYKECLQYLNNNLSSEELANQISQNTRHFAKRQFTFWKNEPAKRNWNLLNGFSEKDNIQISPELEVDAYQSSDLDSLVTFIRTSLSNLKDINYAFCAK